MSELAAHLVDRVIPEVPVRQWALSLPWVLRALQDDAERPGEEGLHVQVGQGGWNRGLQRQQRHERSSIDR